MPPDVDVRHEDKIQELRESLLDLHEQNTRIQAKADAESRDLTEDEEREMLRNFETFTRTEAEIERRERIKAQDNRLRESVGRKTDDPPPSPSNRLPDDSHPQGGGSAHQVPNQPGRRPRFDTLEDRGKWGWRNFGEFAMKVRVGCRPGGALDPRLIANAPTTFGQEGVGADGGFAVPPDFRTAIMEKVAGETSLYSRTDQQVTSSNAMTFPVDETTPWQTSGGVQAAWMDEGAQLSQSKPQLRQETVRANKIGVLVPVTEELLEDAGALDSYLRRKAPAKIDFSITDALVNGDGVGKPLGILNSPALVSVAKETDSPAQAADTVLYPNIVKMWNRLYAECRPNAVWLVNQDVEPQLYLMQFDRTSTVPIPVYLPAGGASASPFASLMGRPVVPTQACQTLGDKGDIVLADLSQYLTVTKGGGIRTDVSMHLWFDYDMLAFRFIMRVGGQPWWKSAISPKNGTTTYSCFVTLDERA